MNKDGLDYKLAYSMVKCERDRQMSVEGWGPENDDKHDKNQLDYARLAYQAAGGIIHRYGPEKMEGARQQGLNYWPWGADGFKPSTSVNRNWVKAGALGMAEYERRKRAGHGENSLTQINDQIDFCIDKIKVPYKEMAAIIRDIMTDSGIDIKEASKEAARYVGEQIFGEILDPKQLF